MRKHRRLRKTGRNVTSQKRESNGQWGPSIGAGKTPPESTPLPRGSLSSHERGEPETDWSLPAYEVYKRINACEIYPHPVVAEVSMMIGTTRVEEYPGLVAEEVVRYVRGEMVEELETKFVDQGRAAAATAVETVTAGMMDVLSEGDREAIIDAARGEETVVSDRRVEESPAVASLRSAIEEAAKEEAILMDTPTLQAEVIRLSAELTRIQDSSRAVVNGRASGAWIYTHSRYTALFSVWIMRPDSR